MLTTGGVFYDESQKTIFDSCGFSELSFVRTDDKPLIIRVPKLTFREIRKLDCQLPLKPGQTITPGSMPASEAENYAQIYRYFPNFSIVEL